MVELKQSMRGLGRSVACMSERLRISLKGGEESEGRLVGMGRGKRKERQGWGRKPGWRRPQTTQEHQPFQGAMVAA